MSILQRHLRRIVLSGGLLIFTSILGCGESNNREPVLLVNHKVDPEELDHTLISEDYILKDDELSVFQKGRSRSEILDDLHGNGNLEMATLYDGKRLTAIGYGIFGGPFSNDDPRGQYVWAIFIDDKFEKLVEPDFHPRMQQTTLGDFGCLTHTIDAKPINLDDIRKSVPAAPAAQSQTDLGLAAAWLVLGAGVRARHEHDLKRNVELRSQFNGLRLDMGMDEGTVEKTLKATPLLTGNTSVGIYKVYGSEESLDVISPLHNAVIVTLFTDGKLTGIYSGYCTVDGNDLWRQELCKIYSNVCP